jgi:VWFA-related protein
MRDRISMHLLFCLVMSISAYDLALGLSTPNGSDDRSDITYHSSASEVRLVFFATDEHNRPVESLQKDDFAVVDDEMVIRNFRSFTRSASIKLDVIVLFDSSESVLPHFKQEMADILQLISQWPWKPEDDVSVLSFSGTETHTVCSGDCLSITADRMASAPKGGSTPLFDALDTAATLLNRRRQPDAWPVIILFSDGDDTISMSSFHGALEKILASGAQIYAVDVSSGPPSTGTVTLQRLAEESGGRCVRSSEGAARVFRFVIDDLHSARVITYPAPESGSNFHSIRILPTHNLNLQFHCRRGYYHRTGESQ